MWESGSARNSPIYYQELEGIALKIYTLLLGGILLITTSHCVFKTELNIICYFSDYPDVWKMGTWCEEYICLWHGTKNLFQNINLIFCKLRDRPYTISTKIPIPFPLSDRPLVELIIFNFFPVWALQGLQRVKLGCKHYYVSKRHL